MAMTKSENVHQDDPIDAIGRKSVLLNVDGFIILTEFCERLAYYGFAGSLVLFFQTQLGFSNAEADVQYSYWSGACYITPLIGGYIADSCLGRYRSILIFSIIYLVGLILVIEGSIPGKVSAAVIFMAMYIVAIGTCGIKPNVSTLGADQFDDAYSQDRKEKDSFFNWFYWSINLGAMISYTVVAYVCQYGIPGLGGLRWAFFTGYSIPTVMMALAIIVFIAGTPRYKIQKPSGSILAVTVKIIIQAIWKYIYSTGRYFIQSVRSIPANVSSTTTYLSNYVRVSSNDNRTHSEKNFNSAQDSLLTSNIESTMLSTDGINSGVDTNSNTILPTASDSVPHLLDRSKQQYGGSYTTTQVECVKLVTRLTPFLIAMIPYWGVYSQMSTAFQNQGCQMNLYLGEGGSTSSFAIPVSALNIFDTLAILLLLPLFDRIIYPYFKQHSAKYPLTSLSKIGWGFVFAFMSMIVAASVEAARIHYAPSPGNYYDPSVRANISPCQNIDDYNPYRYQQWLAGIEVGDSGAVLESPSFCQQICNDYYVVNSTTIAKDFTATYRNLDMPYSKSYGIDFEQQQQYSFLTSTLSNKITKVTNTTQLVVLNLTCIHCDNIPQMSSLSVLWQIPQFILVGISGILASITSLDFFYSQAPSSMRSVTQSFNLATSAIGSLIMIPLIYFVNSDSKNEWLPQNLDQGHLTWYFLLLALLMVLNQLYFWYICQNYEYKTNAELQITDETVSLYDNNSSCTSNANEDITTISCIEKNNDINNSNNNDIKISENNKNLDNDNNNDNDRNSAGLSTLNPVVYHRISVQSDQNPDIDENNTTDESKFI